MINVKIKLVEPFATMPTKAHDTDACFDLYAPIGARKGDFFWVPAHSSVMVDLGFATEIPEGYFAAVLLLIRALSLRVTQFSRIKTSLRMGSSLPLVIMNIAL